jgi:hypothetical protein
VYGGSDHDGQRGSKTRRQSGGFEGEGFVGQCVSAAAGADGFKRIVRVMRCVVGK